MMVRILSKPAWIRLLWAAGILLVVLGIGLAVLVTHVTPIVRARAIDMLRSRFDSDAEFGELHVTVLHGIFVSGKNLVLRRQGLQNRLSKLISPVSPSYWRLTRILRHSSTCEEAA